jgi:hypothetical protein
MPKLKMGVIYTNVDPKKNNFVNSIIPVSDRIVSEKLYLCYEIKKGNDDARPEQPSICKKGKTTVQRPFQRIASDTAN